LGNWLKIGVLVAICLIPLFIVPAFAESEVVIFQVDPFPDDEEYGWVRLYNPSDNSINLSGWEISTTKNLKTYTLSGNIKACDFKKIIIPESQFDDDFEFNYYGSVVLYDNNGEIVDLTPSIDYGWINPDVSLSCYKPETQEQEPLLHGDPEPVGIGFYENKAYEFSFQAPTDWNYQENIGEAQVMIYPKGFSPLLNLDSPKVIVVFENLAESEVPRLNGQEILEYHTDTIRNELGGKLINSDVKDTPWGWEISTEFIYLEDLGFGSSLQLHTEQRAFHFKDREYYTVAYFATDDYYDAYYPVFEGVIDSLVIKGVVVPEFQEIAIMVLASSIILVVVFARKFTSIVGKSENS